MYKRQAPNLISYSLLYNANGDEWKEIKVIFNGSDKAAEVMLPKGKWTVVARDGKIDHSGLRDADGTLQMLPGGNTAVEPCSALILYR